MKISLRKKLLLLIGSGVALSLARSPKQYFKVIKETKQAFNDIERKTLAHLFYEFRQERLVSYKDNPDGTTNIVLTENGKKRFLKYKLDEMVLSKPDRWDRKWRLVIFDIPEKKKKAREALRRKLKELGFHQFQKSIFVYPHVCEDEINFVVEVFEIRKYVRLVEAVKITNEAELKLHFGLY